MVKRIVRVWILNENVYKITIVLYNDNTYTYNAFTSLQGEANVDGEGWHEDMLKTDYQIKKGDNIGVIKLKGGEEIVVAKNVKTFEAYPEEKNKCIIS
jgi:hypothetical protein